MQSWDASGWWSDGRYWVLIHGVVLWFWGPLEAIAKIAK